MKFIYSLLFASLVSANLFAAPPIKEISDASINKGETVTFSKDTVYLLTEKVFVESTAVLNIKAGTVIKGKASTGENASALIICRGAKIYATGTKYNPIVFTAESDNFGNLKSKDKGLWGGVVLLGGAITNEGQDEVEGIAPGDPRSLFGGTKDDDTTGVLQYVSIRHTGAKVSADNELNGLSVAGVGRGTVMDHIETYASSDDGFEWWGGSVNGKYLVSSFCDDDAFDIDQGFRGKLQFIFSIQDSVAEGMSANYAGEWDGDDTKGATPFGMWNVYNATFIGGGSTANANNSNIIFKANAGANVYNSIFSNFKNAQGVVVEDVADAAVQDARKRFEAGEIVFKNNLFWSMGGATVIDSIARWYVSKTDIPYAAPVSDSLKAWGNAYADPMIKSIAYANAALDPTLKEGSPAYTNLAPYAADSFIKAVNYKGAFDKENWVAHWTALWDEGISADVETAKPEKIIRDSDINASEALTFSKDTVYILAEKVFVETGATLTIQAGTVIKGDNGTGENATALIICRGGKIIANGTAANPIIFTAISDDIANPSDLSNLDKGLWGGVVILGAAITNEGTDDVEGIAPGDPRSQFGGQADDDSSGVLRYVSIRHTGAKIAPDNELNGLSLAGVGSKTVLEYVESFASSDDGFEWWGGSVNGKYLISSFCDDDAFDIDQGFRGKLQFIVVIQDSIADNMSANYAGEWDGDDTKGAAPFGNWTVYNATFIGGGSTANKNNSGIIFKANAGAKVYNSIFANFKNPQAIVIEDVADEAVQDAKKRFEAGDIVFKNNLFWNFGGATVIDSVARWYVSKTSIPAAPAVSDSLKAWANSYVDPMITSIGYKAGQQALDLRLVAGSPALSNVAPIPANDPFFTQTDYKGAFKDVNWANGWSFLSQGEYFTPAFTPVAQSAVHKITTVPMTLSVTRASLKVSYALPTSGNVFVELFDLTGKRVASINKTALKGLNVESINIANLSTGSYVCSISAPKYNQSVKFTLTK